MRAQVIQALVEYREPDLTTFHYVSEIPAPPEAFIAHPYTLLQTHKLVGRQPELNLLTDWVAKPDSEIYNAHILNIVAIGGLDVEMVQRHRPAGDEAARRPHVVELLRIGRDL